MPYTQDEIIELTAIRVQEVVCPKIERFMDGVTKEVHQMHLEMKQNREFDAGVIAGLNDVRGDVTELTNSVSGNKTKIDKIHILFCENGYMEKFEKLCTDWNHYLAKDRILTCPIIGDVKELMTARKEDAAHRNGERRTRKEDKYKRLALYISLGMGLAGWATLFTKLLRLW